ncbi:LysM receptor kinase [Parasponia andersonii]|uniref:LysM receptor kinase n=1 Tax=Parasponia andersonii TaxID=3476 RepID=A0A2P5B9J0_PARAD|nr:LysM receptor kinase [Parasponia andersonii]
MEVFSPHNILCFFFFISLFPQSLRSQQPYLNNSWNNCSTNHGISKGYHRGDSSKSCKTFVTFRSRKPYNTAFSIAYLLGSEASKIASVNNMSSTIENIPTNELVMVPITCTCSGDIYQHLTPYAVKKYDTYFKIATNTYQNLTTCQASDRPEKLRPGRDTSGSSDHGSEKGDTVEHIRNKLGVSEQSILEANILSQKDTIFAYTTLLVPLRSETCHTNPGMFFCGCPRADGSSDSLNCISHRGKSKFLVKLVTLLVLFLNGSIFPVIGNGFALLCLFLSSYKLYNYIERRKIRIRKECFFKQNGGLLLQEKLSSSGSNERAKLYTAEELRCATDNFNQSRFLGKGGYGTVYKGMLTDGSIVAVKRSRVIGKNQIEQFINEVIILSQINHRNIVKLLGCCLETETPLLVYEFVSNGTLSDHIREKDPNLVLSWEKRFNIASDVAGALAYMHSAASMPIFHRDIKSSNILLDDKFNAKISDFGTSRSVPHDKTHLTTAVQGTLGYMDPAYFRSSQFTDKRDVYSYGVTLVEILTGENPFSFAADHDGKNLVATFIAHTKENQLAQILEPRVPAMDAEEGDIRALSELATRCLRLNGKKCLQ